MKNVLIAILKTKPRAITQKQLFMEPKIPSKTTVIIKTGTHESCKYLIMKKTFLLWWMLFLILNSPHVCEADKLGNINLASVTHDIGRDVILATSINTTNTWNNWSNDLNLTTILKRVASTCEQHCIDETNYFNDEPEVNCLPATKNSFCVEKRCLNGCEQWWRALQDYVPCTEACVSAQIQPYDMICISACKMAQHNYWYSLQLSLQTKVDQVKPLAFYETNHTKNIHLEWLINLPTSYLFSSPSHVEYRIVRDSEWHRIHTTNCTQTFNCLLDAAALLTSNALRFRYALHLGAGNNNTIYSPTSNILNIITGGPPTTAPVLREYIEMGSTHFACIWQESVGLSGYKLTLQAANLFVLKEEILAADAKYYILDNLSPESNYTLKLAKFNEFGEGPTAEFIILPQKGKLNHTHDLIGDMNSMLLIGEFSIKLKIFKPLLDTKPIFESDELISDYDVHLKSQLLYVITAEGNIYRQFLHDVKGKELLKFNDNVIKMQPQKIAVDWINQRLFMACKVSSIEWLLATTNFDLNEFKVLAGNLTHPIEQLQVDPINGWLFWRDELNLSRLNLASNSIKLVTPNMEWGFFVNDYARYLLLVYNKSDTTFSELSYDGMYVRPLSLQQQNFNNVLFGEIHNFYYSEVPRLFVATNGTHVHIENEATGDYDLFDLTRDVEWCTSIVLMSSAYSQPIPTISHQSPEKLQALFSNNMANISWQPPPINYFQTAEAFRQWEYELEIMDVASNSVFTIRKIRATFFNVEKLQANNVYSLRVRTMEVRCFGPWSKPMTSRTWPQSEHKFLWATNMGLYETNELGLQVHALNSKGNIVQDFVQANSTIYFIGENQELMCANIISPEFNCSSFLFTKASSLAYDWRGGKLYWSDIQRDCLIRSNLDGSERELLPIFDVRQLELDVYSGHVYYTTDTHLIRRTLSGSLEIDQVEFYKLNAYEESILGFALNLFAQNLYWLVLNRAHQVILFSAAINKEQDAARNMTVLSVERDIRTGSLQYLAEIKSLMWVDNEGKKTTFMRLENLAQNQATLELHELGRVNIGKYKLEYTPYRDNSVIPGAVDESSIILANGFWNDFHIKWTPVKSYHNCTVFYKILLKYKQTSNMYEDFIALEVKEPQVHLVDLPQPQLLLHMSIISCTWWQSGPITMVKIRTPAAEQAEPKRLRVYLEQLEMPLEPTLNLSAHVRWDPPENISKNAIATYKVYCWLGEELFAESLTNYNSDKPLETIIGKLQIDKTYTFQVQAFAPGSFGAAEKTVNFSLHVNPEVQSIPKIIYTTNEYIGELDLDLKKQNKLVYTTNSIEHLAYVKSENRLLWVNENVELITCILGSTPIKLARMRAEVISLTVDWIGRIVYWAELETDTNAVGIYKLDLCQFEGRVMTGTKLLSTSPQRIIKDLLVLPFSQTLLWLEFEKGSKNASLNGRNITDLTTPLKFKDMTLIQMFEGTLSADMEIVNLIVAPNGKICGFDVQRQLCTPLKINLLEENVTQVERDNGYIYALKNDSIIGYNRLKQHLEFHYEITDVYRIKALNNQVYPAKKCLLPQHENVELYENKLLPVINKTEETYVILDLPKVNNYEDCWLNIPGLKYALTIFDTRSNYTQNISSNKASINITQLQPFKQYRLQMKVVSYYQQKLDLSPLETGIFLVNTTEGVPMAPQNFTVVALSPTEIDVSWLAPEYQPCANIWYQLYWQLQNASTGAHLKTEDTNITLNNLKAGAEYSIVLKAHCTPKKFNSTKPILVWTYSQLEELRLVERQAHNLTLSWQFAENLTRVVLVCRAINVDVEQEFSIDIMDSARTNMTVSGLLPKTKYDFYLELQYFGVARSYQWPQSLSEHYVFETLGTAPSAPGQPQIELIAGEIFKVFWSVAANSGAPIVEYSLEALQARKPKRKRRNTNLNSVEQKLKNNRTIITMLSELPWADELEPIEDKWMVYCNTSELSCIVRDLHTLRLLMFRVRARNEPYGWGPYSEESAHVQEPFLSSGKRDSLVLAILAPAAIVSSCVIMLVIIRMVKTRRLRAKKLLEKSRPSVWSNLSSLQQHQIMMSRHRTLSVASHHSTFYSGGPLSDADIALLPHISWNQITLLNFLGSGAFGEVFEGLVKYDDEDEPERVAIKSLRKGASEFSELLQEAQLMSNFRHENIVRLVGVCCDTESISIIMEHMEGGDLLNYLRESRPNTSPCTISLQLIDLVLMCLDVARGCAYLEEMHFVHRDLACRNCLVSSKDPSKRQVKIGDFGLARDIYNSDYYRKEGEGLLPVRWMSPESLVDGIFTTQSDVWAFAVLCWEILSYGQQPYAVRNNFEVLNYVKEGGRLDKPTNCPEKLFLLMLECWQIDPEERPSFARCVDTLLNIKSEIQRFNLAFQLNECDKMKAIYANETSLTANTVTNKVLSKNDETLLENDDCHISLSSDNDVVKTDLTELHSLSQKHVEIDGLTDESHLMVFKMQKPNNKPNILSNTNKYEGVSKF